MAIGCRSELEFIALPDVPLPTLSEKFMPRKLQVGGLGARERQILESIYRLGEGSVAAVRDDLPDPPSYSAVRTMIRLLEKKGLLRHRRTGTKYIYRPVHSHESASRSALSHVMHTFFRGSATDAVAAILDVSSSSLTDDDLNRLEQLIDQARREGN
jgi:predicted transcriptional regulator